MDLLPCIHDTSICLFFIIAKNPSLWKRKTAVIRRFTNTTHKVSDGLLHSVPAARTANSELLATYLSVEVGASCFNYHSAFSEETVSYMISTGVNSGGSLPMYGIRSGSKESYAFPADVDSRVDIPVIFRTAFRAADLPDGNVLRDRIYPQQHNWLDGNCFFTRTRMCPSRTCL